MFLLIGLISFGAFENYDAINDSTVLMSLDDQSALEWIKQHTPEDARFFVNTTNWGYGLYRGWMVADGYYRQPGVGALLQQFSIRLEMICMSQKLGKIGLKELRL